MTFKRIDITVKLQRRSLIALALLLCALVLQNLSVQLGQAAQPGAGNNNSALKQPNIVFILIDDLGWADFSCFGNTAASTPNIDRLASEGIRFKKFYVNSPICSPSRCAITTGQYPQRWKITSFLNNRDDNARRGVANWLDPNAPTLAKVLQSSGYATGHFGKWHLGGQRNVDDAPEITEYGFDESLTNFEGMGAKLLPLTLKPGDKEPGRIWEGAERLGSPVTWMLRSQITTGFIDAAIPFMDQAQQDGKPFFVNLWPDDVHSPFWPSVSKWREGKRQKYHAVLEEMDQQLGKLFNYLAAKPEVRDNTILILCSDNGPEAGAGSAAHLRGTKGALYEGGIRSPLIVWAPGLQKGATKGSVNDESVFAAFDLVPSLVAISQSAAPEGVQFDGRDVSKTLLGESKDSRPEPIFWRRPPERKFGGQDKAISFPDLAVRHQNWKLVCDYDGSNASLYDLSNDESETTNVAHQHADVVEQLSQQAIAWHRSVPEDNGVKLGQ